jgi:hypothetical protein
MGIVNIVEEKEENIAWQVWLTRSYWVIKARE